MRTSGRTILITGGAGGIGRAMTRRFLAEGNRVILCGRSLARLEATRDEIPGAEIVACDVADRSSVADMTAWLEEKFPELDTVINNAAITHALDIRDDGAAEAIEQDVAINIMGTVNVTAALLPLLQRNQDAMLGIVTSGIAYAPASEVPGYSLTKAALNSFARSLRYRLRDTTVRVVEIVPPAVDTEMTRDLTCRKMTPDQVADKVLKGMSAGRPEIRMGQTHLSYRLNRLSPRAAEALIRASF